MWHFLPFVFIISTDTQSPIGSCVYENPFNLNCDAYSASYGDSEVWCYNSWAANPVITKYTNLCYYYCNQQDPIADVDYYSSISNYNCGALCNTLDTPCVGTSECTDVRDSYGFCRDTSDQCLPTTDCDPTVTDPCLYRGTGYECLPVSNTSTCTKCTHPCESVSSTCDPWQPYNLCDVTTTDANGGIVATGEEGNCRYTDLPGHNAIQCLTCLPFPTTFPSIDPSRDPSSDPSTFPSMTPSVDPSHSSSDPSAFPSMAPSANPSDSSSDPSTFPSMAPSADPSDSSSDPSTFPSMAPSADPSDSSSDPSTFPSMIPSANPSEFPTIFPSINPSSNPSTTTTSNPCADVVTTCNTYGVFCDVITMDSTGTLVVTGEVGSCQYDANQCVYCKPCPDVLTTCTALDQDCNVHMEDANDNIVTGAAGTCVYDTTWGTNTYGCFTCYPHTTTTQTTQA
eukprot:394306_1